MHHRFVFVIFIFFFIITNNMYTRTFYKHLDAIFSKIETEENIPRDLLKAISIQESYKPWEWTISVNGKGHLFKTKDDAVKYTKAILEKEKNVDIGCMQINMIHHKGAFNSLEDAFNPENNIRYAAKFLKIL